jgi:hypothetical protein
MNTKVLYYYGTLAVVLCAQVIATVFTLSQNIGYGQKISLLEHRKASIAQEIQQHQQQDAQQLALRELSTDEAATYQTISQVLVIKRQGTALASR